MQLSTVSQSLQTRPKLHFAFIAVATSAYVLLNIPLIIFAPLLYLQVTPWLALKGSYDRHRVPELHSLRTARNEQHS
ncbi:hypothetical protein AZE42_06956 [Rhizopogon vesiculosus]|uniref:CSC1/OSCA1-like 7TM region domain-containing protein n=1 Tax=Rhizopogon vesiculosus TaxID=180088 RepID=A0A1J8PI41_9AGAM|nr:hypothetical protein AZE42_06956 [Rhizopogon vesiculosus]